MSVKSCLWLKKAVQAGLLLGMIGLWQPVAGAGAILPSGGRCAGGAAEISIAEDGLTMNVDGHGAGNLILWDSFSVGKGAAVNFGGTYDYLNYVQGGQASEIYGTLSGGGRVYLVNPQGVVIGAGARIQVGSLIVSTQSLSNLESYSGAVAELGFDLAGEVVNRGTPLSAMEVSLADGVVTFANPGTGQGKQVSLKYGASKVSFVGKFDRLAGDIAEGRDQGKYVLCEDVEEPVRESLGVFKGELYGGGHKVKLEMQDGSGLFGALYHAKVEDLELTGQVAKSAGIYAGALAGLATGSNILNVKNSASVSAGDSKYVGGLVGLAKEYCRLEKVANYGSVTGRMHIGGIAGKLSGGELKQAENHGQISCSGTDDMAFIGGLVGVAQNSSLGAADAPISNLGKIDAGGKDYAGGIAGYLYKEKKLDKVSIRNAANQGDLVNVRRYAGGIAGYAQDADIGSAAAENVDVFSSGHITTADISTGKYEGIGSLVGTLYGGKLVNALSQGQVIVTEEGRAGSSVGGAVGASLSEAKVINVREEAAPPAPPENPAPEPGGNESPAPEPGGNESPAPEPGGNEPPAPEPGGNEPPAPEPGGNEPPAPEPGGDEPPAPEPGGNESPAPEPGANEPPAPEPGGSVPAGDGPKAGGKSQPPVGSTKNPGGQGTAKPAPTEGTKPVPGAGATTPSAATSHEPEQEQEQENSAPATEFICAEERLLEDNAHQERDDGEEEKEKDRLQGAETQAVDISHSVRPVHISEKDMARILGA